MEKIDYSNAAFSWRNMSPSEGDDITALWGRKLVNNFANAYGLIGTVSVPADTLQGVNLNLSKLFNQRPSCYFYFIVNGGVDTGDYNESASMRSSGIMPNIFSKWYRNNELMGDNYYCQPTMMVVDDSIFIQNPYNFDITIYYRIHGV